MNHLYYGDNLAVLRAHIASESVDLIYLDPPFNSKRDYNLLFKSPKGHASEAQIEAFEDTWHWNRQAAEEFDQLLHQLNADGLRGADPLPNEANANSSSGVGRRSELSATHVCATIDPQTR